MDFFEAQARAKKRTTRLVVLFALAVIATVLASYAAALFGANVASDGRYAEGRNAYREAPGIALWQPRLFFGVTAAVLAVVGLASLTKWIQFSAGGKAVAESVGARRVDPRSTDLQERRLLNVVEEMAIAAGVPVPAVYLLADEPGINAFAAGLTTSDAVVAVTRGTLDKLNRDELQGVIGHEFSHILNGDMRLNSRITALLFGILVLGLAGRGILWSLRGARFSSRGNKNSGGGVAVILFAGFALLIIGYAGYFFGRLIQAAVSRQREYLADASAVQFTRNPLGLSGALQKIGGYEIGSRLETSKAAAIGHFFFAQSFRTGITGLWATHPSLADRIRAINPQWDGKMFTPRVVVDVASESFVSAGLAPRKAAAPPALPPLTPAALTALVSAAGSLGAQNVAAASSVLEAIAPELRDAARTGEGAAAVVAGLVLDEQPAVRQQQVEWLRSNAPADDIRNVERLLPVLSRVPLEQKLPLAQLALPALRELPAARQEAVQRTLRHLAQADGRISTFEFALEKTLERALTLARDPQASIAQIYSFNAVVPEIGVVLSALAHAASNDEAAAAQAFAAGAAQLKLIAGELRFVVPEDCSVEALDAALGKLATASGPIKQRTLLAGANVVSADQRVTVAEAELLRAVAATLDVPLPPLAGA